ENGLALAAPVDAFLALNERFVGIVGDRLSGIARGLDHIEDMLLSDREDIDRAALGPLRLEVARYNPTFLALKNALHRAANARVGGGGHPVLPHLPHLMQEADDFNRDAAALQERARLLYEEMDTRLSAITNRSLRILTILSTLILPATFVTGAFG